eukprot:TRINITY_DN24556_c0_g2_i1.p1 TRINITY_DN24556_c0_g2~~TRINITY_DN24556_c0_g2_i1.p1  ORF type:complete len:617 (+),score=100.46 TRINITY_DN24556_c0_g2_i1:54-1853(+)
MASPSFKAEADEKIKALASKQAAFSALSYKERIGLLNELLESLKTLQPELPQLGDAAVLSMGYKSVVDADATPPWCLEQLLLVMWVANFCNRFKATLEAMDKTGKCPEPKSLQTRDDGRIVANVFPMDSGDAMKPNKNCKVELWMKPGQEATQGAMLQQRPRPDSVGLVLGAGNVAALAVSDCLHLLFQQNTVTLLKIHPLREYSNGFVRTLFAPLISKGYFDTIKEQTKIEDAKYLVSLPQLCNIHMTGSTETHDAIVWGPRAQRDARKKKNDPVIDLNKVTVTSELGCVTPYMVCPGSWQQSELVHHAKHLAVSFIGNNGYYCNSPKVLVLAEGWAHKDAFLTIFKEMLKNMPPVAPYYPGSHSRYEAFEAAYAGKLEKIKGPGFGKSEKYGDHLPWTLLELTVDPSNLAASANEYAFRNEPFCPVITVVTLKGVSAAEPYLELVPSFCKQCLWGTLSCSLIAHPETPEAALDKAVANLEYGSVVLNAWSATAYGFETGVWGGYAGGSPPRESIEHAASGLGFVNNALAFNHVEKCVARCPFIDPAVQHGTGPMMDREQTASIVNLLIRPGLGSLLRLLFPRLHKFTTKLVPCRNRM